MDINAAMTTATAVMINSIGMTATYTADGGTATTITVLFDDEYQSLDLEAGQIVTSGPVAYCKSSDVPSVAQGDEMTISTVSYTVSGIEPDGTGMTLLRLRKVP